MTITGQEVFQVQGITGNGTPSGQLELVTTGQMGSVGKTATNSFALIGDSRIAQMFIDNAGVYMPSSPGHQKTNHFFNVANGLLGQRMKIAFSYGITGATTSQYLVNLPLAIASGASWLLMWSVYNDINQAAANGDNATTIWNRVKNGATTAINAGMNVILMTEPGGSTFTATQIGMVNQFNEYLREYASVTPGIFMFDISQVILNPNSTTITYNTSYSNDGIHLNGYGSWFAGNAFSTFISPLIPAQNSQIFVNTDIAANGNIQQVVNPLMVSGSGGTLNTGFTGTIPASFSIFRKSGSPTGVVSVSADANGYGNDMVVACTFAAAGDIIAIGNNQTIGNFTLPGDIVDSGCEIQVASGATNLKAVYMSTLFFGQYSNNANDLLPLDTNPLPNIAMDMVLKTVPLPLTTATTAISWQLFIEASGAGSATVTLKRPWLRRRYSV